MARNVKLGVAVLSVQILFIVFFTFFVEYGPQLDATSSQNYYVDHTKAKGDNFNDYYPMFQDTNIMIFFGVGFLYTFLRKYGYTGVGMNFLLAAIAVEWSLLSHNWWHAFNGKIHLDVTSLIAAEFAAASAVIALGGIFGKVSPLQMIVFTLIEVLIYTTNELFCISEFQIADAGGSVSLHMFAGIFGCAAAYTIDRKKNVQNNPNENGIYVSNLFTILGTILLWVFWPSFNSALETGDLRYRSAMNTFLALLGSCLTSFAVSSLLNKERKFTMSHIQNASLAGGVAIGAVADLMVQPFGALLIGALGGSLSVMGFKYLSPFLADIRVYDPCGINSLHGLPGFFSGLAGIFMALMATETRYGHNVYKIYPAMAPQFNSTELLEIQLNSPDIIPGIGRSAQTQACLQLLYVFEVIMVAVASGLITGLVLRFPIFDPLEEKLMYLDEPFWDLPTDKEKAIEK